MWSTSFPSEGYLNWDPPVLRRTSCSGLLFPRAAYGNLLGWKPGVVWCGPWYSPRSWTGLLPMLCWKKGKAFLCGIAKCSQSSEQGTTQSNGAVRYGKLETANSWRRASGMRKAESNNRGLVWRSGVIREVTQCRPVRSDSAWATWPGKWMIYNPPKLWVISQKNWIFRNAALIYAKRANI